MREFVTRKLRAEGCRENRMIMLDMSNYVNGYSDLSWGKAKNRKQEATRTQVRGTLIGALHALCEKTNPTLIVITDDALLSALAQESLSTYLTCGSLYWFAHNGRNIPMLSCMPAAKYFAGETAGYLTQETFKKIARWANGEQRRQPAFDYTLCEKLEQFEEFCEQAATSPFMALDIETNGTAISCLGHSILLPDGAVKTCTVPLIDKRRETNGYRYWSPRGEATLKRMVRNLYANTSVKILQNGWYDTPYLLREGFCVDKYLLDIMNMQHALFCEAPKRLWIMAAVYLDFVQYWKDDIKGERDASFSITEEIYRTYWRYNGLDTYYTLLIAMRLLEWFKAKPYAYHNYDTTFRLSIGPCFDAAMAGCRIDKKRWEKDIRELQAKCAAANESLQNLVSPEKRNFNPASTQQVSYFLYDFLGARKTRLQSRLPNKYGAHSTDKKVLKLIREQHNPFIDNFLDRYARYAKPSDAISFFGNWRKFTYENTGRVLEWLNACGTETGRMSSGHSMFWCGGNGQNVSGKWRTWFAADPDYVLLDIDYSASDDRWVAYEAEDPVKMELVESGKDSHCFHAAMFFGYDYNVVKQAHDNEEDWIEDPEIGIRSIVKRVGHGKNYDAQPPTIYDTMGRAGVVHAAIALGHKDAANWSTEQLLKIVEELCAKYDDPAVGLYKRLIPWRKEIVADAIRHHGLVTNVFGFTRQFMGDLTNHKVQRELAAQYGQGDTAGNANRALLKIYYGGICDFRCRFIKQVHDSLVFQIHKSVLNERVAAIKACMEEPTIVHGRSVRIPADAKVDLFWGKHMASWRPDITYEEIIERAKKQYGGVPSFWPAENISMDIQRQAATLPDTSVDFDSILDGLADDLTSLELGDIEVDEDAYADFGLEGE